MVTSSFRFLSFYCCCWFFFGDEWYWSFLHPFYFPLSQSIDLCDDLLYLCCFVSCFFFLFTFYHLVVALLSILATLFLCSCFFFQLFCSQYHGNVVLFLRFLCFVYSEFSAPIAWWEFFFFGSVLLSERFSNGFLTLSLDLKKFLFLCWNRNSGHTHTKKLGCMMWYVWWNSAAVLILMSIVNFIGRYMTRLPIDFKRSQVSIVQECACPCNKKPAITTTPDYGYFIAFVW